MFFDQEVVMAKRDTSHEVVVHDLKKSKRETDKKYRELVRALSDKDKEMEAVLQMKKSIKPVRITARKKDKDSRATVFAILSDFHIEETVRANTVNGLNVFNLRVAEKRARAVFRNTVRLTEIIQKDIKVDKMVLALLGDFVSGNIHEELLENCSLSPIDAILFAQDLLSGGIKYILKHTELDLEIVCHVGNHSRITAKTHHSTEAGNSLEYMMYHNMALYFKDEPRIIFHISESYHSFVYCYGWNIRFHHGHAVRYGGGVGGITIPMNKAVAQWNKGMPDKLIADIDVMGHFHQFFDGGNFICNGSLIGYNTFAKAIKASFEPPRQTFFVIDKLRGKTIVCPILTQ